MDIKMLRTLATSAVLALSLLSGAAIAPAFAEADAPIDVICWDMEIDGQLVTECDEVDDMVAECALSDPDNTSEECADAAEANKSKPHRTARVPQSLSDSQSDNPGGGFVIDLPLTF